MSQSEITFRRASAEDSPFAIPLIYSSGPAAFDYAFKHSTKGSALDFLAAGFSDPGGQFGHENHTVAVIDEKVVGIGTAYSGDVTLGYNLKAMRQIFSFYGLGGCIGIAIRGLQTERVIPPPGRKDHYIAHLGVSPDCRSRGIGAKLVAELVRQGRELGRKSAMLHVAHGNDRAQALYERLGFVVTHEIESKLRNEHAAVPSHRTMRLTI